MTKRSKSEDSSVFYGVRVNTEIAGRVEAMREYLQAQSPYTKVSTSDVLRMFIEEGSKGAVSSHSVTLIQKDEKS